MELQEGACYRARDGRKIGPMYRMWGDYWFSRTDAGQWNGLGDCLHGGPMLDLVAEWNQPVTDPVTDRDGACHHSRR